MPTTECPPTRRAELFVRSDLPYPSTNRRTALEARLQALVRDGVIDEFETTVWEKRVPVDGTACTERSRYEEFTDWASDAGVSLAPFFDTRLCYSTETGEKRAELVMPALCLAVYEGGDLAQVAPFAESGRAESIEECLDDLSDEAETPGTTITTTTAD